MTRRTTWHACETCGVVLARAIVDGVMRWQCPQCGYVEPEKRGKYNAQRVTVGGIAFDSKAEARRYVALCQLQKAGEIRELLVHPRYELQPAYVDARGRKCRAIQYEADFSYITADGLQVVEDVKGVETAVFKLKRKMFEYRYRENARTQLRVLGSKEIA